MVMNGKRMLKLGNILIFLHFRGKVSLVDDCYGLRLFYCADLPCVDDLMNSHSQKLGVYLVC